MASSAASRPRWSKYGRAGKPDEPSFRAVPRVAPFPVSSGVSVRKLPEARFVDIVKCCHHYETKCAGKYDKGSIGARLLFDLSRDIQDLSQSLVQSEENRDERVTHLERVTREWNAVFQDPSPELRAAGVTADTSAPGTVARRLVVAHQEAAALRQELDAERADRGREAAALRRGLQEHAAAAEEQTRMEARRIRRAVSRDLEEAREAAEAARREAAAVRAGAAEAVSEAVSEAVAEARRQISAEAAREVAGAAREAEAAVRAARAEAALAREEAARAAREAEGAVRAAEGRAVRSAVEASEAGQRREAAEEAARAVRAESTRAVAQAEQAHATSVDAGRVRALEAHCAWLQSRVAELQRLSDGLRSALGGGGEPRRRHDGAAETKDEEDEEEDEEEGGEPVARASAPVPSGRPGAGAAKAGPGSGAVSFTRQGDGTVRGGATAADVRAAAAARGGRPLRGGSVVAWVEPAAGSGVGGAVFTAPRRAGGAHMGTGGAGRVGPRRGTRLYAGQPSAPGRRAGVGERRGALRAAARRA